MREIHGVTNDILRAEVVRELHQRRTKSNPTVIWRTASGRVVATSHSAPAAKPKPAEASSDSLMAIARLLAAEGMAATDPALRSRLLNAAGSASIRADAAHGRELQAAIRKPIDKSQVDRWVAEASARYPA